MSYSLSRLLKLAYRREPIVSCVFTVGLVDALLGGLESSGSLLIFGLAASGSALAFHWWRSQRQPSLFAERPPVRYLPDRSDRPPLPMLGLSHKQPPPPR
ncbi:MAG: hypothetical protein HC886_06315 [Leptolyngbyaceae cyanobacterium SM1_1_3]|nr:hypothetical protein [Leptolyngbyaceae cyanobacterium SM1_1_3]NJN05057.1 hypothetical protein [Leptolyngbyaceae cyanobacterium RM1_1_2]NJO10274.1 hypothetical protein [Leptolyngbyaceae cyanobacterium SL_1_1]